MIAALALLVLAGVHPSPQPVIRAQPAVARPAARPATPVVSGAPAVRVRPPEIEASVLEAIQPELREAVVCAAHMELLMEKLSARGETAEAPIFLIEDYWFSQLPDPDGPSPVSVDALVSIKDTLATSASNMPSHYLRGLQDCVLSAARGGALAH